MSKTAHHDTPEDHGVATELGVGKVPDEQRQTVGEEVEGLPNGVGNRFAETEGTLGGTAGLGVRDSTVAVATRGKALVDVVGPDTGASVVRGSLTEFDGAEEVRNSGQRSRNTTQSGQLLFCGLAFVVSVKNGYLVVVTKVALVVQGVIVDMVIMRDNFFAVRAITVDLLVRVRWQSVSI